MAATAVVFQERLRIPLTVTSLRRFREWARTDEFPERGVSYIGGQIEVDMSPEELNHNKLKTAFDRGVGALVEEDDLGDLFCDGVLVTNELADLSTVPDLIFVSYESIRNGTVEYVGSRVGDGRLIEVVGAPDVAIEIVSETTVRKDTLLLRERYWMAGVREYWLADGRGEEIDFTVFLRRNSETWTTQALPGGWQHSDVFARQFRLTRTLNRVGGHRYGLDTRAAPA